MLKKLKENYEVYKQNKGVYHIHSKTEHGRFPHKFLCVVNSLEGYYWVGNNIDDKTKVYEELVYQINYYLDSLEFDSELYFPAYTNLIASELFINDYVKSIGFENHGENTLIYAPKSIFGLNVTTIKFSYHNAGMFVDIEKPIVVSIYSGYKNISINIIYVEDRSELFRKIKETINTILKPLFLSEAMKLFKIGEGLECEGIENKVFIKGDFSDPFNPKEDDFTERLKQELSKLIK